MNPEEIIEAYENGERNLQPLLDKMGWKSWLGVAELGLVLDSDDCDPKKSIIISIFKSLLF